MKKLFLASAFAAVAFGGINAQVVNRALAFTSGGSVDCGAMPRLDNLGSYSIQFWLNPNSQNQESVILSRGNDFAVKLNSSGNLTFKSGESIISTPANTIQSGEWNQVTMICNEGNAEILINDEKVAEGSLYALGNNSDSVILGGGYEGLLDEVRIWDDALDDTMSPLDYFTHNTLNKWCPMWENLVAYYKMDQENCPYLVDYKGIEDKSKNYDNHGILSQGVTRVEALNEKMPYLINSAYTNNERFYDRIIPREQYLLSNDLIILGVNVYASDGHLETKTPNYHARSFKNAEYLAEFDGREGVVVLKGNSQIELPESTVPVKNAFTFETWINLDEWTPGAYILRKENEEKTKGVAVYLGDESEKRILVRVNGKVYASTTDVAPEPGKWTYFAFCPGSGKDVSETLFFFKDNKKYNCDGNSELTTGEKGTSNTYLSEASAEYPVIMGENLKGKLDDTCFWLTGLSQSTVTGHRNKIPMPGLDNTVSVSDMQKVRAYYKYDDPEDLGFSSHSQDSWLKIMKSAYEGHAGVKFHLSVAGSYTPGAEYGDWRDILGNSAKCERFAEDLSELSKNYDGVELDLEWIEQSAQWPKYGELAKVIREKLPEGKEFRISLHNSYTGFPVDYEDYVDGFTFQQYGPQAANFSYNNFETNVKKFMNKFDHKKIMTSYSTTTSKGEFGSSVIGVKGGCLQDYEPSDSDADKYDNGNDVWTYMGPMQVYKRAKYTRENNLQGIFYWDMGNDLWEGNAANPVMPVYNQAKYCSYAINANNDTIVTNLKVNHYGEASVNRIEKEGDGKVLTITPSPAEHEINVALSSGEVLAKVSIYSMSGSLVKEAKRESRIDVSNLTPGIYLVGVTDEKGRTHKARFVKR